MSTAIDNSEQALVDAIRQGSSGAFERFFKSHYQALCGFAATYVKDADAAEDIVQNTFLTIWQKREGLELRQSLKSYLYTSVRNACLNKLKSEKIRDQYRADNIGSEENGESSDHLEEMELSERISKAIVEMPPERQKIFLMSREEGLKYKEIAEKLNKSIKTVENQMGKALKYMREELADFLVVMIFLFFLWG